MIESSIQRYSARLRQDVDQVLDLASSLTADLAISDPILRRSFKIEGVALASHWVAEFSAATPEMAAWAALFRKGLETSKDLHDTFAECGFPNEAAKFVPNRVDFYKVNGASWQLDERLFVCWLAMLNSTAAFAPMKMPPLFRPGQQADLLSEMTGEDKESVDRVYGLDSSSGEFSDLVGDALNSFLGRVAKIVNESSKAFVAAVEEGRKEGVGVSRAGEPRRMLCALAVGAVVWCGILGSNRFHNAWSYPLSRMGITAIALWLAIQLRQWVSVLLVLVAILFNPFVPVDLDGEVWRLVSWLAAGIFCFAIWRIYTRSTRYQVASV